MKLILKMTGIILALGVVLTFGYTDANAQCCLNQSVPPNPLAGQYDDGISGTIAAGNCTSDAPLQTCGRLTNLQWLYPTASCGGGDPEGIQNAGCVGAGNPHPCCTGAGTGNCEATGTGCVANGGCTGAGAPRACCTGAGTGNCGLQDGLQAEKQPDIPALSGWGVLLFLLLASGSIFAHRRRSRTFTA